MAEETEIHPLEMGDRILILGGTRDGTRGRIYYLDETMMKIMPDGVSDRVVTLPFVDGDFDPELGVVSTFVLGKRASDAFVVMIDARVGSIAETFGEDGAPGTTYTIKEVSEEEDSVTLVDETGGEMKLEFNGIGIPLDAGFEVLRPRVPPSPEEELAAAEADAAAEEAPAAAENEGFADVEEPLPVEESFGLEEVPESERFYNDREQRDDMLGDTLASLSGPLQKLPKQQRLARQLVEQCMLLRNELVLYAQAGRPIGRNQTSYQTVVEVIEKSDIPLARPVLDARRRLYLDQDPDGDNPSEIAGANVAISYVGPDQQARWDFLDTQIGGIAEIAATPDALPMWYLSWEAFFKRFMASWTSEGGPGDTVIFRGDKEFLRAPQPTYDEDANDLGFEVDGLTRPSDQGAAKKKGAIVITTEEEDAGGEAAAGADAGLDELVAPPMEEQGDTDEAAAQDAGEQPIKRKKKKGADPITIGSIGKVRTSLLKGLGPRMTRLNPKEPQRRIESGQEGVIVNQLLFPLSTEQDLGSTRSGQLAKDIAYSQSDRRSIQDVLRGMGGIPETATAGGILSIGVNGNTSGSIAIDDWLRAQPIHASGLGDAFLQLKNLGLTQKELTADQQAVLVDKIQQYRALLRQAITEAREAARTQLTQLQFQNETFLQGEALEDLMATLTEEPLLSEYMEQLKRRIPAYKQNDIALFAETAAKMSDLLVTALAGQPAPLARERNRLVSDRFLDALRKAMLKAKKGEMSGEEPTPVKCAHVDSLTAIRKIEDPSDRMKALARLLANFQREVKDNWVICSASAKGANHNLLCYHEVLLLQEFLHPLEKDRIHKELILSFGGAAFQGHYICNNCGQPIADMDYDRNLEFDENGRPLATAMANTVDLEEVAKEKLDLLLGGPAAMEEEKKFDDDTQNLIYKTAQEIFARIGIYCDMPSYMRVIERVEAEIRRQPTREDYAKKAKAKTEKGAGKQLDYDVYINRILVTSTAAHILIEIQAKVPDFIVRYRLPGCVASFNGFPFGAATDKSGLQYIACAVASIRKESAPWSLTGFLAVAADKKRQDMIQGAVEAMAATAMKTATVQQLFIDKRAYLETIYGRGANLGERLPEAVGEGFRPVPYKISPEEAAQAVVVPQAANPQEVVRAWIQTGHRLARTNGVYVAGSPFAETTCCFTPITDPRGFWTGKDASLPALPTKQPPRGQAASQSLARFTPRRLARLLADPPEDLFYRVFLRVCYDGPRKGLPHEIGYRKQCAHCGIIFEDNPFEVYPGQPLDKGLAAEWKAEMDAIIMKGKTVLESQGVAINKSTFEEVLDATHTAFQVTMPEKKLPTMGSVLLARLAAIQPEPFQGWRALMAQTIERAMKLPPSGADELSVAEAYGALSNHLVDVMGDIQRRLGGPAAQAFQSLLRQSPSQIVETVRTYFLVTFQRLLTGFRPGSLFIQSSYKLPSDTKDDNKRALSLHLSYLETLKKFVKGYTAMKLGAARDALTAVLPILQKEVRANLIPGGALGLPYLVGAMIMGIFGDFINPNVVPATVGGAGAGAVGGAVDPTARVPLNILEVCLARVQAEGLGFTEDQIRDMIARRDEMEKMLIIKKLELPPEEKKVAMMIKRLGLKEWATGARNVYSLNADQYEHDREQRIQMGLVDFGEDLATAQALAALQAEDNYGGGGTGAEAGYEHDQMGADDY